MLVTIAKVFYFKNKCKQNKVEKWFFKLVLSQPVRKSFRHITVRFVLCVAVNDVISDRKIYAKHSVIRHRKRKSWKFQENAIKKRKIRSFKVRQHQTTLQNKNHKDW